MSALACSRGQCRQVQQGGSKKYGCTAQRQGLARTQPPQPHMRTKSRARVPKVSIAVNDGLGCARGGRGGLTIAPFPRGIQTQQRCAVPTLQPAAFSQQSSCGLAVRWPQPQYTASHCGLVASVSSAARSASGNGIGIGSHGGNGIGSHGGNRISSGISSGNTAAASAVAIQQRRQQWQQQRLLHSLRDGSSGSCDLGFRTETLTCHSWKQETSFTGHASK